MRFREGKVIRQFSMKGKKVAFRYPRKNDLDGFLKNINSLVDEKAYLLIQKKLTRSQERKWLEGNMKDMRKGDVVQVCVDLDGRFAGSSQIKRKHGDARRHIVELGISIHRDFRGMGIGTELMKTMEALAKSHMKAKVLELSYEEDNIRSKHLYEKLGYKEVGRIPKGINHYGKYMDEVLMVKVLK
jgi:RimJ/RimL family protein N-acetyltransferase